jgi:flagellar basal body-associated protein FliL
MKKNILAIVILAATLVNVTLSAMILFTFVPYVKKANNLITDIAKAIELDINGGPGKNPQAVDIADLETFNVLEAVNVNLKMGEDGKTKYAQVTAFLSLNTKHEDYAAKKPVLEAQIETVKSTIINAISNYTAAELNNSETKEALNKLVLEKLQTLFDSTFIYSVDIRPLIAG